MLSCLEGAPGGRTPNPQGGRGTPGWSKTLVGGDLKLEELTDRLGDDERDIKLGPV